VKGKNRAQEFLEQVEKLNAMIENKMVEVSQWRDVALGVTSGGESVFVENKKGKKELHNMEKVQSSGSPSKMADAVARIVDLQDEINCIVDRLIDTKQEIIRTIEQLNATEYDVLHKRYIQGMTFDEIGAAKGKSKSWATTVHGRALQNLNKILDERDRIFREALERFRCAPLQNV
jgi:hypothetical protein